MIAYVVAGLAFTIAFGLLVIWAFNGIDINSGSDETKGIAEIAGGLVALTFALLLLTGRIGGPQPDDAPSAPSRWRKVLEHRLTVRTAAVAGPATHIPGLFYLIALNVIVAHHASIPDGLIEVLIYNVVWFALPIAALTICFVNPPAARRAVEGIQTWALSHTRELLLAVSFGSGAVLIVRGIATLSTGTTTCVTTSIRTSRSSDYGRPARFARHRHQRARPAPVHVCLAP